MSFINFVEGPLYYFAITVFVLGAIWRLFNIVRAKPKELAPADGSPTAGFLRGNIRYFFPRSMFAGRTWLHILGGYSFHLGLFGLMLFAAPHVLFISERITGFGWPTLPRWAFILTAEIAFAGLIVLWVRRFSDPVMRLITDWQDHVGTWLTFLVMLTGCFSLQESHEVLRAIHMLSVDIWLLYFPFGRLMHAFTFFLSRGKTGEGYARKGLDL